MANSKGRAEPGPASAVDRRATRRPRDASATRAALVEAAAALLPDHQPSDISGRQIADVAGVNYGLVHHHFGGKDGLLDAGMSALRDDFVERFGDGSETPFLGLDSHPFLRATVRALLEHPRSPRGDDRFSIVSSMVGSIADRLEAAGGDQQAAVAEAQARAIAAIAVQVFYGVFGAVVLEATGVTADGRAEVESRLGELYDTITARS